MKIQFKKLSKVDLTKVFPVISEADYKLIAGSSLIIPDSEYEKIQKKGHMDVGPYPVSKELIEVAKDNNLDPVQQKLEKEIAKKYVNSKDFVDIIYKGVTLEKNVIAYGKGGHAKSEMTVDLFKLLKEEGIVKEEPFIMSLGDGLTEETLLGGIDIKKFKDTGELKYLLHNSFIEHEVVVFEEIFDAPPQILLALKDILTSKEVRKGNQRQKIKTKIVIGLTNRSKEEFSEDDSLEALTQRFPLTLKVEWDSYGVSDWQKLFKTVFTPEFNEDNKHKLRDLSEILAQNHTAQTSFCSPRTAVHAAMLYCNGGDLKYISDIDNEIVKKYFSSNIDNEQMQADSNMFASIEEYIKANKIEGLDTDEELLRIILDENEARTGEKIEVETDPDKGIKVKKLQYAAALIDIHNWNKKNMDKAKKKKQEILDMASQLSK